MNIRTVKQRFGIIGNNEELNHAIEKAIRVANTDLSVLITGESGTGKEVFSKMIHGLSNRKHESFIAVNCGAIPEGTINSELFGHEKGAFTGATADRKGYFETVNKGTIFLDEIGEMPLDTQAYLLRVLENGEFLRVGSSVPHRTDVRVVAATNVDLLDKIKKNKFREDLYYRLNTISIKVPPLRERGNDIELLFRKFAMDFGDKYSMPPVRLDDKAKLLIGSYSWPGNIRQLRNLAEEISIFSDPDQRNINAADIVDVFPDILKRNLPSAVNNTTGGDEHFEERELLYKLLFEMKNDMNDLKSLVYGLIKKNDLSFPEISQDVAAALPAPKTFDALKFDNRFAKEEPNVVEPNLEWLDTPNQPEIRVQKGTFDEMELVDESLNIEDMEKDLIKRALRKHSNRRKEAAQDLGISERTLYRKIKQYDLQ